MLKWHCCLGIAVSFCVTRRESSAFFLLNVELFAFLFVQAQNRDVRLYTAEINQLKKALVENNSQLIAMEAACLRESDRHVELEDSLIAWQDKYERLHESHKRVQKVNQSLEDKLLKLVDRNASERAQLTSDVATLSVRLAQANYNIATLQREIVSSFTQTRL